MKTFRIAALLFPLALLATSAGAQTCPTTEAVNAADKTAVVEAMRAFYAAATADDLAKIHSVTAPTFYAFDVGHSFSSIDDLFNAVKAYQDQGVRFVWTVTQPRVTIRCNQALLTYLNDGSIQMPNSTATPMQWLESAVLERQQGAWKIVFFHSTQVPAATPAK